MTDAAIALAWIHQVTSIPETGLSVDREASAAERAALVQALPVLSIERIAVDYRIVPAGGGRFRLSGTLVADATQQCVISLEPVPAHVDETFSIELWPPDLLPQSSDGEQDVLVETEIEPLKDDVIDVGRIVFELMSAGLDPYPRKPGAEFQWHDPKAQASKESDGPFAALAKLKQKE